MISVEKETHKRKNRPVVWAVVWVVRQALALQTNAMVLGDWDCQMYLDTLYHCFKDTKVSGASGHDPSGTFTLSN